MAEQSPPPSPIRARRWSRPRPTPTARSSRFAIRLIGIPAAAVAGVLLYGGVRDRLVLPECDSSRAKNTLSDVLRQLKLEPERYEPLKTVSAGKDTVVCSATLPLPDRRHRRRRLFVLLGRQQGEHEIFDRAQSAVTARFPPRWKSRRPDQALARWLTEHGSDQPVQSPARVTGTTS